MIAARVLVSGVVLSQPMGGVRRHNAELLPRAAALLERAGGSLALLEGREGLAFELPASVERIPSEVPAGPPLRRAVLEGRALDRALREAAAAGRPFALVHTAHFPVPRGPRAQGVPFTVTVHDLRSLALEHTPFSRRLLARGVIGGALRRAAGVFTVSEDVRRRIVRDLRVPEAKVRVVPNAADHLEPLPRAARAGAPLLSVGHLEPRKNLALLLEALALDPGLPDLELAGRAKGEEGERLAALARERGVAGRVRFLGPVDDQRLRELYARAACVVLPSRLEGFGIPALEAQCAGAPLAVSRAGALVEVAGEDVPSFDPDDAAGCARAIRAALETPERLLAERARRAARFTWDASAELWVRGWEAALSFPR